jgi:CRISPR-associated endonuclease/helicase Cas3
MKLKNYKFDENKLKTFINNDGQYFAHILKGKTKKETLIEHLLLVQEYFFIIIKKHKLEKVILNLIENSIEAPKLRKFMAEIFVKSIAFHDFGKTNPNFQIFRMENNIPSIEHNLCSTHSLIGGYIFTLYSELLAKDFPEKKQTLIDYIILSFSYPIIKHHSPYLRNISEDILFFERLNDLKKFTELFSVFNDHNFINEINEFVIKNSKNILQNEDIYHKNIFPFYALIKLNYSLLTASDYYATTHFMSSWKKLPNDFGLFNKELKNKIVEKIEKSKSYNEKIYSELENYKFKFPQVINNNNLNKLRQNLAIEVIKGIRKNIGKNLFYIEVPTGGGKTNLSMLALAEFLRYDLKYKQNNITKVFYVFPFTTLITQTFKSLKETLGLNDDEIVQIHFREGFSEKSDDNYGDKKENIIDYQFVNYPIALLSHIRFFNILKSNKKSINYLMHRLANSVVIIDELQSYPPNEWDKIIFFINNYAKYFNIKFILMSATLPKINKLLSKDGNSFKNDEFINLIAEKRKYFRNPNFANRVNFDFEMLNNPDYNKENREEYLQKLWNKIKIESENYKKYNKKVHTIIEFIFKKTASEFLRLVNKKNQLFDEVFILSGTILEPRRKEIIARIKSKEYGSKSILLITTQVVEAGVDIDMDIGFKNSSLIDSDEQLAGRINRNMNKPQCKLYLFDLDDASVIYGKDARYKKIKCELKTEYENIIKEKNFDKVYNAVMDDRNKLNKSNDYINLKDYLLSIRKLNFYKVDRDFKIINDEISNISVYIPINITIYVPNSKEKNFTRAELEFLKRKNMFKDGDKFISGLVIWKLFEKEIKYKDEDFVAQKKRMIVLQGLMSKFSFSINIYSKLLNNIIVSGNCEEKHGYYFLQNPGKVYDYETGIKELKFEDINCW